MYNRIILYHYIYNKIGSHLKIKEKKKIIDLFIFSLYLPQKKTKNRILSLYSYPYNNEVLVFKVKLKDLVSLLLKRQCHFHQL